MGSLSRRSLGSVARLWFLFELEADFDLTPLEPNIPGSLKSKTHFAFRTDIWHDVGGEIVEHVAGVRTDAIRDANS